MAGRSQDARTREYDCDGDARKGLTEQAEGEESGSATVVIGLIGSRSHNSSVVTSNPNKRITPRALTQPEDWKERQSGMQAHLAADADAG